MSLHWEPTQLPEGFAGVVRLFPLPNIVLFPHVIQPLHIFEPRYRQMVDDALAGDQIIAMARLQPGWEEDYEGRPAVHPVICVGKVIAHTRFEDGRYNLLLQGVRRASLIREFPPEYPFRLAEVAVMEDLYPTGGVAQRARHQRELLHRFQRLAAKSSGTQEQIEQLLQQQIPLGVLTDIISFTLPFELDFKQQLLAEWDVDIRTSMLIQRLKLMEEEPGGSEQPFPPGFSSN